MKRKIVLWGNNEKDEKILVALELFERENEVKIYSFAENVATEAFYKSIMDQWRSGEEIEFPEHQVITRKLSVADSILPDEIKVDRADVVTRAQTEWHFVVLSTKLYDIYNSELEDLKETVSNLSEFDNKVWNEMKGFWNKVQEQVIEKNLFREHASNLKNQTNKLFDDLKQMKKKMDEEFRDISEKTKASFKEKLGEIETKVEKGLGLKPIFEELKDLQNKLKKEDLTRKDRNELWDHIDKLFKEVKEKRFGNKGQDNAGQVGRLQRRYDGLINAISKMQKSIARDKSEQSFQDKKIASTEGQLELQIRQAKIKMIDQRVASKEEKLNDMLKTKEQLEAKIKSEKDRQEKREKMEAAKAAVKEKIAEEVKTNADLPADTAEKVEKAAAEIKQTKTDSKVKAEVEVAAEEVAAKANEAVAQEEPVATKPEPETSTEAADKTEKTATEDAASETGANEKPKEEESLLGAIGATLGESFEDMVDTVKAVADVVEDKIEEKVEEFFGEEE